MLDRGRWAKAEDEARKAADWWRWSPEPWQRLGEAELGAGDTSSAAASFRKAVSKDATIGSSGTSSPRSPRARRPNGRPPRRRGSTRSTATRCRKERPVLRVDPLRNPEPLIRRVYGYVAYRIGDGPDAEDITSETFERALRYPEELRSPERRAARVADRNRAQADRRTAADARARNRRAGPRGRRRPGGRHLAPARRSRARLPVSSRAIAI